MSRECSIVKDLLPLYIEDMVSEETASFIEEHLNNCEECKNLLNLMKENNKTTIINEDSSIANNGYAINSIKKQLKKKNISTIIITTLIVAIVMLIGFVFLGSAHSDNYYSQPIREVEQLSTDYYLGPTINENNNNISNIKHFEELDGITESASPIGYYIQFEYKENDIACEVVVSSFPLEKYEGDLKNSNVHVYEGHEIYMWEFLDEERNFVSLESNAILGDFACRVNVGLMSPDDVNFERYKEISLEFMFELIDDYIANN